MSKNLIDRIPRGEEFLLKDKIEYQEGGIASLRLTYSKVVDITLLAVYKGEKLQTHSADGDAFVQMLEGEAKITVDGVEHVLKEGESILLPVSIPHSLEAISSFKFLLTVVYPKALEE